ncbi:MAG: mycofactocin biosynthesis glycosyltransferase MftF [Mycobacteriaceae bacterium]
MRAVPSLPPGFRVALDPQVRHLDGGAALLGGSPLRLLRLKPAARQLLAERPMQVRDRRSARLARQLLDAGVAHPCPLAGPSVDEVTVVIPVRDNAAGVDRLLRALDTAGPVIVVDDGSRRPQELKAVSDSHGAHLRRHATSRGPAAARNTGLAHTRTPFVVFLDSDVVPDPGWLPPLLRHMSDPAVGLVAPRIAALAGASGWIARYETVRSSLDLGPREAPVVPRSRVAYVPSAALLVRVAAMQDRAFDGSMPVAEDVDLCWRLHAEGWRLRYDPASRVAHEHRVDTRKWLTRKAFYGTGAAPLAERHPGQVPPVVLAPWTAAALALLFSGTRTGVLGAAVVTGISTVRIARMMQGLEHPLRTAAVLASQGQYYAVQQLASAAYRSYWPLTVLAAVGVPRMRRALVLGAVLEGVADWAAHREPDGAGLDPLRYVAAKRLDDAAYGAGLWWGAVRARSVSALRPSF